MKNDYQELMGNIHVPEKLKTQVLQAARQQNTERAAAAKPKNLRPILRGAVCAVCALALVLSTVRLDPVPDDIGTKVIHNDEGVQVLGLTYDFGLTAYAAAAAAKTLSGVNSGIVFYWMDNCGNFRIVGEGIETVSLSVDRGALWRAGACLGDAVTEALDPSAVYGVTPAGEATMDSLDGATLTLTAVFTDGTKKTDSYHLSTENLRVFENENGETVMVPALTGDPEGMASFLYAVSETDSVWLRWPVEGANTVSLSNAYGYRWNPGGETRTFHGGIDIPAEPGTPITAAAAGTVTKAEFDPDKGNYLVLDHGDGMETLYAQCLRLEVAVGDTVEAGQTIAAVGSTGKSTGPHLCFQVWQEGQAQNPVAYFDSAIRDTLRAG